MTCEKDTEIQHQLWSLVRQLANCDKCGKDITTQRLIVEARKLCGWPKKELLR